MTMLKVSEIRMHLDAQPRAELSQATIDEYAAAMLDGAEFPAVTVFHDGADYWLADGFHRTEGAKKAGIEKITADVRKGTLADACLYSCGANVTHGLRRTNEDKRRAVERAISYMEGDSDNKVAKHCGVSHPFVGQVRASLVTVTSDTRKYTDKHGNESTMNVTNIGHGSKPATTTAIVDGDTGEVIENPVRVTEEEPAYDDKPIGIGIRQAHEAINALKRIPPDDALRVEGLRTVAAWIRDNP